LEDKGCEAAGNCAADLRGIKWRGLRLFGYKLGQASVCCKRST